MLFFFMLIFCILGIVGCGSSKTYMIKIVVPAGSTADFVYSEEEISPTGHVIKISSGEGLSDTEVILKTIEVKEENVYEPTYLTPGLSVDMDVEKNAWFKIGISMQNDTDEDKVVYVEVEGVEVRIEEKVESISNWGITFTAENITLTGLTIRCTQNGGELVGELQTGGDFVIEKLNNGTWEKADYILKEQEVAWTSEAWMIPMNDDVEWEVNWEWLYGKLPAGKYRIGKGVMDFKGPGDYDSAMHYAEFEIKE